MTEKQLEKIKLSIKQHRAILAAEKKKYGGFDDSYGRRYAIAELYMKIADYKGAITYKRWFDKNFPDDGGSPILSLYWSIAFHGLNKMASAETYAIDMIFQNIYFHGLLLDKEVYKFAIYEYGHEDMLDFARSQVNSYKKTVPKPYLDWLSAFIETDTYKTPFNEFIALSKLILMEQNRDKRIELLNRVYGLKKNNKNQGK